MEMETIPLPALPLISREHLSEEDHNYLVDKMVEGEIGTKEEVLKYKLALSDGSLFNIMCTRLKKT
jgi:hypothetical protein